MSTEINWPAFTTPRPFHVCEGCFRDLAPGEGAYCYECERWKRASGAYPTDADQVSSGVGPGSKQQP